MTFRIIRRSDVPEIESAAKAPPAPDSWSDRIVKLIPAEALGLYGAGQAIIPDGGKYGMYFLTVACIAATVIFRFNATRGRGHKPQTTAIAISVISFLLWLLAISNAIGPFELPTGSEYWSGLLALTWGVILPGLYKGDAV